MYALIVKGDSVQYNKHMSLPQTTIIGLFDNKNLAVEFIENNREKILNKFRFGYCTNNYKKIVLEEIEINSNTLYDNLYKENLNSILFNNDIMGMVN